MIRPFWGAVDEGGSSLTREALERAYQRRLEMTGMISIFHNGGRVLLTRVEGVEEPKKVRRKIGRLISRGKLPKGNYVWGQCR